MIHHYISEFFMFSKQVISVIFFLTLICGDVNAMRRLRVPWNAVREIPKTVINRVSSSKRSPQDGYSYRQEDQNPYKDPNLNELVCCGMVGSGCIATAYYLRDDQEIVSAKESDATLDDYEQFFAAIDESDLALVQRLVIHLKIVNACNENGYTALQLPAERGDLTMVKILVENGATVEAMTRIGKTAFILAKENDHKQVVAFLRAHLFDKHVKYMR